MAWFGVDVNCSACKMFKTPVRFRRPRAFTPSHTTFKCEMCDSHIAVRILRNDNKELHAKGQVKIQVHTMVKSQTAIDLEIEEKNSLQDAENQE